MGSDTVITFTREELNERKALGELFIVYDGNVYNLTKWAKHHPGGEAAIKYYAGRDATDVIIAFHPEEVIQKRMKAFRAGILAPEEVKTSKISREYRELEKRLTREGWYETDNRFYYREAVKTVMYWTVAVGLVVYGPKHWLTYLTSALVCGLMWQQGSFVAHDAGHNAISHHRRTDKLMGMLIANVIGGLSLGWWKDNHNIHHIVTNEPENDPDIQHLPFFAISTKFFGSLYSTYYKRPMPFDLAAKIFVSMQHRLFYVVMMFGRFNLYVLSFWHLFNRGPVEDRKLEIACLAVFWTWFITLMTYIPTWKMVLMYIAVANITTFILHVQITISHFGMSTEKDSQDEDFATMALRTTMDVECSRWLDWFHGGLQFQVIHHLFPRMPRHKFRQLVPFVKKLAEDNGLVYHTHTFVKSNGIVLGALREVAEQVRFMASSVPHLHEHSL
ncbi:fatty acid desaturase-domain-containing protein [Cladochytrium replicatum]|nr:fatty acid desaturase-domain-containing protein [Cladochytrium replicatum]